MNRILIAAAASLTAAAMVSCGSSSSGSEESSAPYQDITAPAKTVAYHDADFGEYVSNTFIATGSNNIAVSSDSTTYVAYIPVEEYGSLDYRFYFSNTVDSTYSDGSLAYAGRPGEGFTIESAFVSDGGTDISSEPASVTPVTFGGSTSKKVSPDEMFWSDPVVFDVPEGHFLRWEWTLTGENIPATSMSNLTKVGFLNEDGSIAYCDEVPLPKLFGAKRDVKYRVTAIGDSITQGCQTQFMEYEFWAARIAQALGSEYSFWNCGLGWSRTSDMALNGDWLQRAANSDVVIVAFGTNDIISGEYGGDGGNTPDEIDGYLRTVLDKLTEYGCGVIVFNAPPEDYKEPLETVRTEYNEKLKATCEEYGVAYFDFAGLLSEPSAPAHALYGGHPNGEGGQIIADEFLKQYSAFLGL